MRKIYLLLILMGVFNLANTQIVLTGATYNQDFNTLATTGTTNALTIPGWLIAESGTSATNNGFYAAGTGSSNTGDTYGFGPAGNFERALGGLRSGTLIPTIGASFINNTGGTISSITINYTGEQWRAGVLNRGVADRLDFQLSTDASSLTTGTWVDYDNLDFNSPNLAAAVGALDGNAALNRTAINFTITGLNIPNGNSFFIRWIDFDIASSDDGLSIDDFSITAITTPVTTVSVTGGANVAEPVTNGSFNISLSSSAPVGGVTVTYSFAAGPGFATIVNDFSDPQSGTVTIPFGSNNAIVIINVEDDLAFEGTELIQLNILSASNGFSIGTGTATIDLIDNDAPPTVSVAPGVAASESGPDGTFIITLSTPAPITGTVITYSLSGTATPGTDYQDVAGGTIAILPGESSVTIFMDGSEDLFIEGTETIDITLTSVNAPYTFATGNASINLLDNDFPPVKINEVYGGGGNTGAVYKNDFIELYNPTNVAVNLAGWSIQYTSAAGTGTWLKTNLAGSIPPNGYYLIQLAAGAGGTADLPTPDAIGTINMSGTAGKVALVSNTVAFTGACPGVAAGVIDQVGYGPTASCFEGAGPAPLLSNTTSAQRTSPGFDTDNNNTDFVVLTLPTPKNSFIDILPPVLLSTFPVDDEPSAPASFTARITFDENVQKGNGDIRLRLILDNSIMRIISVNSNEITVSGANVFFNIQGLDLSTGYYFEIDNGAFTDFDNNVYPGISGTTGWNFTTNPLPVGTVGTLYDFNACSPIPDGFTFYSEIGQQIWGCTTFGITNAHQSTATAPSGVQINGFANGTNVPNVDWLISPSFNLTGTAFPLLSFWSRTAFNGSPLQLKVSTNYTSGDPNGATWTDLNGKFPGVISDVWTLSENINLTAYKQTNVRFAFVYHSSEDDGARWTVDDISIINSATAPPPSLTVSTNDIQFTYVPAGSTADKTFIFIGNDLTSDVNVNATGQFLVSKDGVSFSSSLLYTIAEANDIAMTVYVRFTPVANGQEYSGLVTVSTGDLSEDITLKGTSIDPATTLEVVNWNIEWFGSPLQNPSNDNLQEQNVVTIMQNINADVYALTEIVNESRLQSVVNQLGGYSYVLSNYGSHTNTTSNPPSALGEAQKMAFIYKTALFSNVNTQALLSQGINSPADLSNPAYGYWASGRFPFMMSADVTLNCVTKHVKFVLVHAKANTSPTIESYNRRKKGADTLHYTLQQNFADQNIIILGDYNDDLDETITAGINPPVTSWSTFTNDGINFEPVTLPLSLAGKKSTVSYDDVIDHVTISNDLEPYYMTSTANILTDVAGLVINYGNTTSDHYPVFTRYRFEAPPSPTIDCPDNIIQVNDPGTCGAIVSYTIGSQVFCGETILEQTAGIASGEIFPVGTTVNTFRVIDGTGNSVSCSFTVTINDNEIPTANNPSPVFVQCIDEIPEPDPGVVTGEADNCGVPVVSLFSETNNGGTGCPSDPYVVTRIYRVTDASMNSIDVTQVLTATDNVAPTFTSPADKTILFNSTCGYDASPANTGDVTNENGNCSNELEATYTDVTTQCGNSIIIERTWQLVDDCGNAAAEQVQTITVTDNNTDYIVYANKEAKFHQDNVINGSVGVKAANGKAEFKKGSVLASPHFVKAVNISVQMPATVTNQVFAQALDGPNPTFVAYTGGGLSGNHHQNSNGTVPAGNFKHLTIKKGVTATVNGNNYGKVTIEENANVTFTSGAINIEELQVKKGKNGTTNILFNQCTGVSVKEKVDIESDTRINVNGPKVIFYIDSNKEFSVKADNVELTANVYSPNGKLKLQGGNGSAVMTGWFIVDELHGDAKNVTWNMYDCTPLAKAPLYTKAEKATLVDNQEGFKVMVSPNPTRTDFRIQVITQSAEPVMIRIIDATGRTVKVFSNSQGNTPILVGESLRQGTYFAEVIQGSNRSTIKLLKME